MGPPSTYPTGLNRRKTRLVRCSDSQARTPMNSRAQQVRPQEQRCPAGEAPEEQQCPAGEAPQGQRCLVKEASQGQRCLAGEAPLTSIILNVCPRGGPSGGRWVQSGGDILLVHIQEKSPGKSPAQMQSPAKDLLPSARPRGVRGK